MTTLTIIFGSLLNLVGLIGFLSTGATHPTALIPCALGLLLIIAALVGRNPSLHMHAMHAAVLVALIGLSATLSAFLQLPLILQKVAGEKTPAILSKSATALLCGLFILRSIQWFIQARQAKKNDLL
jgi:hypothetical protein